MRFQAAAVGDGFKRRLLILPMRYDDQWLWLEMVRMRWCGYYTEVLTEADYQEMKSGGKH